MTEHNVKLELYYNSTWNNAPVLTRDGLKYMRGTASFGNDTDPASASCTLDNTSGSYAPLSLRSGLYGKIGQNTPARITCDSSVRLTGEVSSWKPTRPVKGSSYTPIEISGVLRRLGRGADPLLSPQTRAQLAAGPVDYWPLDDGETATSGVNLITGGARLAPRPTAPTVTFAKLDAAVTPAGVETLPLYNGGVLSANVRGVSTTSWRAEFLVGFEASSLATATRSVLWYTGGGINEWWLEHGSDYLIIYARSNYAPGLLFGSTVVDSSDPRFDDGRVHSVVLEVTQTTSTNMDYSVYLDGVLADSGGNTTGTIIGQQQVGPPTNVVLNPDQDTNLLTVGAVAFYSPKPTTAASYSATGGWVGEYAADRFSRLCTEEGITGTVVGTAADCVTMGAQRTVALLDQFDEIATTDDASIFETRSALGLTMRTGPSKLNQAPALTVSYIGQIEPGLQPVYGDEGIRNDVTARNPDGSSGRVVQLTGPRNVLQPTADPQGVGRYTSGLAVNTHAESGLADAAGWRVNLGTYDGTWYAEVTVDLDAAPSLVTSVNAVDIGDVVELSNLPDEEATSLVRGLVIGIGEDLPPLRRTVTFHLIPEAPYRAGKLAITSGETDVFSGRLDADGSTTTAAVATLGTSFTVATPSGPIWTTATDDFPLDVVVGGQPVTVSGIVSYLNANPYFETDVLNWTPVNGASAVRSTAQFHEGAASMLITPNGSSSVPQVQSEEVAVTVGRSYTLSGWIRSTTATTRKLGLFWFDSSHSFLSANEISQALAAGTWTQYGPTAFTAPASAAYVRVVTNDPGTPAAGATWYLDEATVSDGITQIFSVSSSGYKFKYASASGSAVNVYQPIILTL